MSIVQITTDTTGQLNVNPRRVKLITTDSLGTITTAGYLNSKNLQGFAIYPSDVFDVYYSWIAVNSPLNGTGTYSVFTCTIVQGVITLVAQAQENALLTSSVAGQTTTTALTSATPGTVRSLTGKTTESATVMTSGNIVGLRGEVDMVGASGGFQYGVQGKVIPTGTLSGSSWTAGVFGQFDLSHPAIINAGQLATIWGDWGATGGTATSMTGARGYAFTNTTANILNAQFYMYGPATNLLELDDNSAGYGATYFVAAGTSSGSAGDTSKCNASKVLKITMNGTSYWIPLFASNS